MGENINRLNNIKPVLEDSTSLNILILLYEKFLYHNGIDDFEKVQRLVTHHDLGSKI